MLKKIWGALARDVRSSPRQMLNKVSNEMDESRVNRRCFKSAPATARNQRLSHASLSVPCSRRPAWSFVCRPSVFLVFSWCCYVQGRVDRCFDNQTLVATCHSLFSLSSEPQALNSTPTQIFALRLRRDPDCLLAGPSSFIFQMPGISNTA